MSLNHYLESLIHDTRTTFSSSVWVKSEGGRRGRGYWRYSQCRYTTVTRVGVGDDRWKEDRQRHTSTENDRVDIGVQGKRSNGEDV